MTGIECALASSTQSTTSCGTPTPAIILVVHIDPGPIPTFIQSAPAPINDFEASLVATLPATT